MPPDEGTAPETGATGVAPDAGQGQSAEGTASWTADFDTDTQGFIENKGWRAPGDAIKAYRQLESHLGAPPDRLLTLPKEGESLDPIFDRLGRPETPEGYGIEAGAEASEADKAMFDWFAKTAHEIGFSDKQAKGFLEKFQEYAQADATSRQEAMELAAADSERALKREWGTSYNGNVYGAKQAFQEFAVPAGLAPEDLDAIDRAIGHEKTMKMFSAIGAKIGEDSYVDGGADGPKAPGFGGQLSPAAALNRLNDLQQDKAWAKRLLEGGTGSKEFKERKRLIEMAYPME